MKQKNKFSYPFVILYSSRFKLFYNVIKKFRSFCIEENENFFDVVNQLELTTDNKKFIVDILNNLKKEK